jgi:Spy/CpxP family protein refolding chaperone
MKPSLALGISLLALAVHRVGAVEPTPQRGPLARMSAMRERLALTDQQWEKLEPLLKQEGDRVRAILDDASLSKEQKRAKAAEATAAGREQIKDILTPEQRQKLAEEMKNRPPGAPGDAPPRMAELKEKLGLSEEQFAKLRPVLAEEGPKLRALRENQTLSREERRAAFESSFGRIAAELTPAQAEQLRGEMSVRRR